MIPINYKYYFWLNFFSLASKVFHLFNLPTTCIAPKAVAVENNGASAVTSHEKLPDKPKPTLRINTCVAFELLT